MSKKLLLNLNGGSNGAFKRWIDRLEGEPRISWYPSSGDDFKDILYLHQKYNDWTSENGTAGVKPPDIYIHTDCSLGSDSTLFDTITVRDDWGTRITVNSIEKLPAREVTKRFESYRNCPENIAVGTVVFLELNVKSQFLGEYVVPVIYAFVENSAFLEDIVLPNNGKLSHIVRARDGHTEGANSVPKKWLTDIQYVVGCECIVKNTSFSRFDILRRDN